MIENRRVSFHMIDILECKQTLTYSTLVSSENELKKIVFHLNNSYIGIALYIVL